MAGSFGGRIARVLQRHAGLRVFRFFSRALGATTPPARAGGMELRMLELPQAAAWCADVELDLDAARVRAAFARGDACVGAFDGERLAGYCWFAFSALPHLDGIWVDFSPEAVWIYKSFVRPSHRGRALAPAMYGFADATGRTHGRSKSLICVEVHNRPSVAAALRAGHDPAGLAAYLGGRRRLHAWYSPAARSHGIRFRTADAPLTQPLPLRGQP